MLKKTVLTVVVLLLLAVPVFAVGAIADPSVSLPERVKAESACPATRCASGECHGFDNVPQPDGVHEMICPEASCSSTDCHAWDSLMDRYHQASDASLNIWIVMPVVLVIALVLVMRKVR